MVMKQSYKMDAPKNKPTITLRRHSTSPSSAGRAVIASVSARNSVKRQISPRSMKSNPYVGWFRHSPSTAPRISLSKKSRWCSVPSSLVDCKNSPHIGWFRHSPPSRLDLNTTRPPILSVEEKDLLWKLLQELNPSLEGTQRDSSLVSGYLRGGGKEYLERTRHRRSSSRPFVVESSAEGTMSTVNALSRLANWFLFPVAHDAESCGYRADQYRKGKHNKDKEDGILSQFLSPYLPSFLEEPPLDLANNDHTKYGARADNETDCKGEDDDSDSSDSDASSTPSIQGAQVPSKLSRSKDLSLSVSSMAEAYYAHQTTTKELSERVAHPTMSATGPVSPHRLDYVITQMDVARMTRNASRHLDVQSILSLPVTTYQKGTRSSTTKPKMDQPGFMSWTIVEESEGAVEDQGPSAPQQEVDFCVICLEHFVNGDRLRVLPCDHSFHVGCIDRWLSGSQSFEECYTSGCPTCKKRPSMSAGGTSSKPRSQSFSEPTRNVRDGKYRSGSLDGSVPSWAFAQIGSAMVQAQDQGTTICSGQDSFSS